MTWIAVFVLVLSFVLSCFGQVPQLTGYSNIVNGTGTLLNNDFSQNNTFVIYYSVIVPDIHVGIVCETDSPGYCAFGVSTTGQMVDFIPPSTNIASDAAVGYINSTGQAVVEDFILGGRLTSNNCPSGIAVCADTQSTVGTTCKNNVVVVDGGRSGNYIWFEFTRPLAASDSCDVAIPFNGTAIGVLFAYGGFLNASTFPFNVDQHDGHSPVNTFMNFTAAISTGSIPTTAQFTSGQATTAQFTSGQATTAQFTTGSSQITTATTATTANQATTAQATTGQATTAPVTTAPSTTARTKATGSGSTSGQVNSVGSLTPMMISFAIGSLFIGFFIYIRIHA